MVIGNVLHTELTPALRKYIDTKMQNFYQTLNKKLNVKAQAYGKQHKKDPYGSSKFFYENINGNDVQSKKPSTYDYKIKDHNDLAKLYMQPRMVKFDKISDGSFDASSALSILSTASCFPLSLQDAAREVKDDVRNIWGHCNNEDWTNQKFLNCFRLFELLVKELELEKKDKDHLLNSIEEWKKDGKNVIIQMMNCYTGCPRKSFPHLNKNNSRHI